MKDQNINNKPDKMKKILTLTLVGMFLTTAITACKSSKHKPCESYGGIKQVEDVNSNTSNLKSNIKVINNKNKQQ